MSVSFGSRYRVIFWYVGITRILKITGSTLHRIVGNQVPDCMVSTKTDTVRAGRQFREKSLLRCTCICRKNMHLNFAVLWDVTLPSLKRRYPLPRSLVSYTRIYQSAELSPSKSKLSRSYS